MRIQDYVIPQDVDTFELELPKGFKLLDIQQTIVGPILFAIEDEHAPKSIERFASIVPDQDRVELDVGVHVGTYQAQAGSVVRHIFHIPALEA